MINITILISYIDDMFAYGSLNKGSLYISEARDTSSIINRLGEEQVTRRVDKSPGNSRCL